jgi:Ser-tRNA(Ala) deacylase AlaX
MCAKEYNAAMHTAEHILNATMDKMFGCGRSFVSHIESKKSKCDYHMERMLTDKELDAVEATVNEVIKKGLKVEYRMVDRREADEKYNTKKLPADADSTIRIVFIGDYDACPCIGTHVSNTREIGEFRIVSSDYNEGVLRIRFKLDQ